MVDQTASIEKAVRNSTLLTDIFGQWPSFHDAEVHSILLSSNRPDAAFLEARVHLWERHDEIDEQGLCRRGHQTLATLRFGNIDIQEAAGFNTQNVLMQLLIELLPAPDPEGRRFAVTFEASYGFGAHFACQDIEVVSVEPVAPVT